MTAPTSRCLLLTLHRAGLDLNLFCDVDKAQGLAPVLATCWAWLQLARRPETEFVGHTEDTLYSWAEAQLHQAMSAMSADTTRAGLLQSLLPQLTQIPLPAELRTELMQHYSRELHDANSVH